MNLRKITVKKPLKLLVLILAWMIVATASAAIYYSLSLTSGTTTGAAPTVKFVSTPDTPSGSNVQDTWCWLKLSAYPNVTLTYDQAVNISNTDTGSPHSIQLRHVSISTPNATDSIGNVTRITFYLINTTGGVEATFEYTTSGDTWVPPSPTGYKSLPADTKWAVKVETVCIAGATADLVTNIEIAVDVQE